MLWFGIVGCLVGIACLLLLFLAGARQGKEISRLQTEANDRRVKVEFMLRELDKVFREKNFKNKTYLCGILDTLAWDHGDKQDANFIGWLLAKKQANKEVKNEGVGR